MIPKNMRALIPICLVLSGCGTTLYQGGQKIAVFHGDMTDTEYSQAADGSSTWKASSVDHSSARKALYTTASKLIPVKKP